MKRIPVVCFLLASCCSTTCAAGKTALPPFSWDTVPVYIHFGKSSGPLTDDEVKFVARISNFVCFEKGHGRGRFGSTEKGIVHDARRLKVLNGKMKVLFYWNGFINYPLYDACQEFKKHPDWIFRDKEGKVLYKVRKLEQYNVLNGEFRQWWASIAGKALKEYGCDGVFMDALLQATSAKWISRGWGRRKERLVTGAVIDMMQLAKKKMGAGAILLYNGLRSSDRGRAVKGREFLPHADGATVEHFGAFQSQKKESIAADIDEIVRAGKAGKIVVVKGWPDPQFNWTNKTKMKLPPQPACKGSPREDHVFPGVFSGRSAGEQLLLLFVGLPRATRQPARLPRIPQASGQAQRRCSEDRMDIHPIVRIRRGPRRPGDPKSPNRLEAEDPKTRSDGAKTVEPVVLLVETCFASLTAVERTSSTVLWERFGLPSRHG